MKAAAFACQLDNLISNKSILENLKNELKNLQDQRQMVKQNLSWDSKEYQTQSSWLKKVDEIVGQVNAFLNYNEGKSTCTNFLRRNKVGKQSRKMLLDISQLHEEGQNHLAGITEKDHKDPKSRTDTIQDIMEALKDPRIPTVGVWGLGGVGTTSLAKQVGRQAKEQDLFNEVVVITVTEKPKVEQVQGAIASELGVQFHGETHVQRRNRLRQRIKKEEKILVIIDDIWGELNPQEFDLEEFGVPSSDEHGGCKLLLTSGNLNFIRSLKGAPKAKVFRLEELLEKEAQSLFEKMVGGVAQDPEWLKLEIEILKSCAGSASSIFAMAKALRNKGLDAWKEALVQLKENVSPIKLCCNSLENEELKSLLLLLTIRGRRPINRYSIYIDMWNGLFKNLETADTARNRRDSLISDLKAYGLLVEDGKEYVKIDDFIWHTAYSMAQNDLQASMISREWPPEDLLKGIRFCNINIVNGLQIPEKLQCPNLQHLLISRNNPSIHVPDSFFEETKLLQVLDFVGFDCSELPVSFVSLKNLEALSMYCCNLGDISKVGELTNLRMFGLLGSSIQQLPAQIGLLQKLLFLDLRDTHLQVIPANVLSNLTSLEELYLRNSFCNWENEVSTNVNKNASLKELTNLDHLAYIEDLYVPDPRAWPVELFFGKLKSYTIFIGDKWGGTHDGDHGLKTLKLKLNRRFQSEDGIKKMLESVDVLYLDELNGVQNILNDLDCDGFPHLQSLFIQNNAEIKCITTGSSHDPLDAFPNLESLSLNNLSNLEHICHGHPLTEKSFFKLRVIKVQNCIAMGCLFSKSMIKGLPHLANMEVSECKSIKAIVLVEGAENPFIEFPDMCSLTLRGLPALISFCLSEGSSSTDTTTLFHDKVLCPNLENMVISQVSESTTIWHEEYDVENSFWKLKNVNITECKKLRTVFPVNLSKIFII
ncbi:Disease resistance protein [Spatholobus suberectus]|nr:Disease resistance protein [Spatholobus suberectus]